MNKTKIIAAVGMVLSILMILFSLWSVYRVWTYSDNIDKVEQELRKKIEAAEAELNKQKSIADEANKQAEALTKDVREKQASIDVLRRRFNGAKERALEAGSKGVSDNPVPDVVGAD